MASNILESNCFSSSHDCIRIYFQFQNNNIPGEFPLQKFIKEFQYDLFFENSQKTKNGKTIN
jgi:hypothetical protein